MRREGSLSSVFLTLGKRVRSKIKTQQRQKPEQKPKQKPKKVPKQHPPRGLSPEGKKAWWAAKTAEDYANGRKVSE